MSHLVVPRHAVAALFLQRQFLDKPRQRRLTAKNLVEFTQGVGGLQIDSINVIDRAHHLTLWSRFGPFDRHRLERMIYKDRVLFEYWAHVACFVATADFPAWRRAMLDYSTKNKAWGAWLMSHRPTLRLVEGEVRARGPLGTADFRKKKKRKSGWWSWEPTTHALDYLWMSGVIGTHSRRHFHKRFDLTERLLPDAMAGETFDRPAFLAWHLERSLRAMGVATETDLRMYMTFPREAAGTRRTRLRAAVEQGRVTEVRVEGMRQPWFVLTDDLPALRKAGVTRAPSTGTTFLCPFDSLLWHRERVDALFDFNYRIEVYVPGPKRQYGYYVLPLLHNGRFIGRADFKTHRAERRLEVRAIHLEPWFARGTTAPLAAWAPADRDEGLQGTAEALRSLAAFVGADDVELGKVAPVAMKRALRRALADTAPLTPQAPPEDDGAGEETSAEVELPPNA
ncbi:MAG: crosslink repair DNA glycosylase YcaQ family protein [Gemmatimonadaceae bacterium]